MRFSLPSPDDPKILHAMQVHLNNYYLQALFEHSKGRIANWYNGFLYIPEGVHYDSSGNRAITPEMYLEVYRKFNVHKSKFYKLYNLKIM